MATTNMYAQVNLNVREGPGTAEKILFTVKKDAIVVVSSGVKAPAGSTSAKKAEASPYANSQQSVGEANKLQSPWTDPKGSKGTWGYVTYGGKKGWAAIKVGSNTYLAATKAKPGKVVTDKDGKVVLGKDGKPVTQEEESNMLPLILGGAAVVFLILAASKK
jgi:hypothetical protein